MATIEELMTRVVHSAQAKQTIGDARRLMKQSAVRHLAIVDETAALVGILSSHDLPDDDAVVVGEAMSADPVTIALDARASEAVVKMLQHRISSLPVVDAGGKLAGILTSTDLLMVAYEALVESEGSQPAPQLRVDVANVVLRAKLERLSGAAAPKMAALALKELRRYLERTYQRREAEGGPFAKMRAAKPMRGADIAELCEQQARVLARTGELVEANVSLSDKGATTVAAGADDLVATIKQVEERTQSLIGPEGG